MKNLTKNFLILSVWLVLILALAYFAVPVRAAAVDTGGVTYPIAELGNCADQAACATYCDQADNMLACVDYADKNGMIDPAEAAVAKKAIVKIQAGQTPGGCNSQESCQAYCQNNVTDLNSCIAFAEEIGVDQAELEQAKKIAQALRGGANMPGGCQGKQSCEAYCQDTSHIDECLVFAEAAQILPADELAEAKKIAPFLKNGQTPGGCKAKSDCKAYCDQDEHFEECINFAGQAGFVSQDELAIAKKTGGKGPGGCKSKQACEDFCNLPENAKACGDFAVEKGLVDEKTAERIKNGYKELQAGLEKIPPEIRPDAESCLNNLLGGKLSAVLSGEQAITKSQGGGIGACFESATQKYAAEQMQAGMQAGGQAGGASGQVGGPPQDINKSLENAPAEVREQIQAEIERQKQEAMQNAVKQMAPSSLPPAPPADAPPPNQSSPVQGPPCSSPEECRAMFGGSNGPPAGMGL